MAYVDNGITNISKSNLEELFERIERILDRFERKQKEEIVLGFADGYKEKYKCFGKHLAHLLGINIPYLRSTNTFQSTDTYSLLKDLIANPYKVYDLNRRGIISYNQLFSAFIFDKVESFEENLRIDLFNTDFVCVRDYSTQYKTIDKTLDYDYMLFKRGSKGEYLILSLKKDGDSVVPVSNIALKTEEEYMKFLTDYVSNQKTTLLTTLSIKRENSFPNALFINAIVFSEKYPKLVEIEEFCGARRDVDGSLDFYANQTAQKYDEIEKAKEVLDKVKRGEIVNIYGLPKGVLKLVIGAYNDYLSTSSSNTEEKAETNLPYTKLVEELAKLRKTVSTLIEEKTQLTTELSAATEEISILKLESAQSRKTIEEIRRLVVKPE